MDELDKLPPAEQLEVLRAEKKQRLAKDKIKEIDERVDHLGTESKRLANEFRAADLETKKLSREYLELQEEMERLRAVNESNKKRDFDAATAAFDRYSAAHDKYTDAYKKMNAIYDERNIKTDDLSKLYAQRQEMWAEVVRNS